MSKAEIVCVIDKSGSMGSIRADAIGGFNTFLQEQKALPGEAKLTLVLFSDKSEALYDRVDLQEVKELTLSTYVPLGSTALYDALGQTINSIGASLDKETDKPDKVIFVILTDGEENSSIEFKKEKVAEMIKHQQEKYSWEFIFLAANQDAFKAGASLNISASNTANFDATSLGLRSAYSSINNLTTLMRTQ
jgi:Mg-chelatase subunit ChlD